MSEENTTTIEAVNFYAELSANNEKFTPIFEKSRGRKWVGWGHKGDNRYPEMVMSLLKNSPLHGMIVKSKANTVSGQGFERLDGAEIEGAQKDFLENMDGRGNSAKEIMDKTDLDEGIFGQRALLVTWDSTWTRIVHASYRPVMNFRPYSELDEFGEVTGYIYSEDWTKRQPYNPVSIPVYSEGTAKENKKRYKDLFDNLGFGDNKEKFSALNEESRTQVIMDGTYLPDSKYFGVPFYGSATTVINADIESDKFALNSLESRLSSDYIVQINGITDPEERNKAAKAFIKMHTGALAANKPPVTFGGVDGKGSVQILPTNLKGSDSRYTEINIKNQQKILSAHGVTSPTLVGIAPAGGLGNSSDLGKLYDLYQANIISPIQARRDKMINRINKVNGWPLLYTLPNMNVFAEQAKGETVIEEVDESNM